MNAFSFEQLTGLSDYVQGLTPSKYGAAEKAFITCEGTIRYRYDGGEPAEGFGHLLQDGYLILNGIQQVQSFKFIGTGTLNISYERV